MNLDLAEMLPNAFLLLWGEVLRIAEEYNGPLSDEESEVVQLCRRESGELQPAQLSADVGCQVDYGGCGGEEGGFGRRGAGARVNVLSILA